MTKDVERTAAQKREEDMPVEAQDYHGTATPSSNSLGDDDEIFAWMQTTAKDLKTETRTSNELLKEKLKAGMPSSSTGAMKLITGAGILSSVKTMSNYVRLRRRGMEGSIALRKVGDEMKLDKIAKETAPTQEVFQHCTVEGMCAANKEEVD